MRKFILILTCLTLLLFVVSYVTFAENTVRVGVDTLGVLFTDYYYGFAYSNDTNPGISLGWEMINPVNEDIDIGPGVEWQFNRKATGAANGFSYLPVYGVIRYNLSKDDDLTIYLAGKLGYNFLFLENPGETTANDGIYLGASVGAIINKNIEFEALYSICNGSISDSYSSVSFNYYKFSMICGYKF